MGKIIQFPVKKQAVSNGYDNLARLINATITLDVLNIYIESIQKMGRKGYLLDGEAEKLIEQGRKKRLEISKPDPKEPERVEGAGVYSYTPEMGQQKPECQMEASLAYYGKHYFVDTPIELKGRGITLLRKYEEKDFCTPGNHKVGWHEYCVTKKAFEKLKAEYSISMERLLD